MTTIGKAIRHRGLVRDARPDVSWMSRGGCIARSDLPWIADPEQTTGPDRLAMAALCENCPVLSDCAGYASRQKVTAGFWATSHRDPDTPGGMAGPGWAIDPLPGLDGLPDLGGLGGAA
jgi:Transcription factor WhiB